MSERVRSKRIQFWMLPELYAQVRAKAGEEHINISDLLRGFLRKWVNGEAEAEPPVPQKGQDDANDSL